MPAYVAVYVYADTRRMRLYVCLCVCLYVCVYLYADACLDACVGSM